MKAAKAAGFLLETGVACAYPHATEYLAWVSNRRRMVIGFAKSITGERDAVRMALIDASRHYARDDDALTELEAAYFGPCGMMATRACAASGQ